MNSEIMGWIRIIRNDLADILDEADYENEFLVWMVLFGRHEYNFHFKIDNKLITLLYQPKYFSIGNNQTVLHFRVISVLIRIRPDIKELYKSLDEVVAWFYASAVREYKLWDTLDHKHINIIFAKNSNGTNNYMNMIYNIRKDLQDIFDLKNNESLLGLINWYHSHGVHEYAPESEFVQKRAQLFRAPDKFGVNLVGFPFGELGIGEDLRTTAAILDNIEVPYSVYDFSKSLSTRNEDRRLIDADNSTLYPVTIFCLPPVETVRFYVEGLRDLFYNTYCIGYWPWELPSWPNELRGVFTLVKEVWAISKFNLGVYEDASPVPAFHVPLAVSVSPDITFTRSALGIKENDFLFSFVFDGNSSIARKNPIAICSAFIKAFPRGSESVRLLIKCMNNKSSDEFLTLLKFQDSDSRITIINQYWPYNCVTQMINFSDCYISLHRSEGFGRTVAEAVMLNTPIITVPWSGVCDFVGPENATFVKFSLVPVKKGDYPYHTNAVWADADIFCAAEAMRSHALSGKIKDHNKVQFNDIFSSKMKSAVSERLRAVRIYIEQNNRRKVDY